MPFRPPLRLGACLLASASCVVHAATDETGNPAARIELPEVQVIGTTPLPGLGQPLANVPANVQTGTAKQIQRQTTLDLVDFMNNNLNGVNVNQTQDNPFQSDVNYRGFSASPLLGTPQGLSVFVDGVRVNESFGDVVNWDLIPESAISTLTLVPGSNPTFGLNTLGGALSVQTKTGRQYPGVSVQAYGGSFGRRGAGFEAGGTFGSGFDAFVTGNYYDEDGWRDSSPSHVRQIFSKVGWENDRSDVDLSYIYADNNLIGNGFTPESMLAYRRSSVFTIPDQTVNHFNFVTLNASHFLTPDLLLAGNVYYRQLLARSLNGDFNDDYQDDYEDATDTGGACDGTPDPDACAAAALADETGVNHRTKTGQRRFGGTVQLTSTQRLLGTDNSFTVGGSYDSGRSDFTQGEEDAVLTPDRATVATDDLDLTTSLYGTNRAAGLYLTDTWSPTALLHLSASGRYNIVHIDLHDRMGTALNGKNAFYRFNPAVGATFTPTRALTLYADYNEGSRTPTPIELGCANPNVPCQLPNALADDPPLQQVVARTVEAGARGAILGRRLGFSVAVYQTQVSNDIQFISSSVTGAGYFANVGRTRRRGLELGLDGQLQRLHWRASYSFVDATYRTPFQIVAEDNSSADADGVISVTSGSRLPEVPRHTGRIVLDYDLSHRWTAGANLVLSTGQFLLENNNNQHRAGVNGNGDTFLGSGRAGGYAVLNLHSDWEFLPGWTLFGRIDNALDRRYATAGSLGANPFTPSGQFRSNPDDWTEENAISPGMPIAIMVGLRVKLK